MVFILIGTLVIATLAIAVYLKTYHVYTLRAPIGIEGVVSSNSAVRPLRLGEHEDLEASRNQRMYGSAAINTGCPGTNKDENVFAKPRKCESAGRMEYISREKKDEYGNEVDIRMKEGTYIG